MPHKDKDAERAWRRKWWAALSSERKAEKQDKANKRNRAVKAFLAEYKLAQGCAKCGYKEHHAALEFDHIHGEKKLNICFAKSLAQAKKEILKCQVLCSNCHRVETYNRAQK